MTHTTAAALWHMMATLMIVSLLRTTTGEGHSVTDGELTHGIATAADHRLDFQSTHNTQHHERLGKLRDLECFPLDQQ